jgi:hypothetical protein
MIAPAANARPGGLVAWQWSIYPAGHRNRQNLLLHALTEPIFLAGTVALLASPFTRSPGLAVGGLAAMVAVMALQGRGHRLEQASPSPFLGPLDVLQRFFVEQWFNFPRYVLTGEFARAWRGEPVNPR